MLLSRMTYCTADDNQAYLHIVWTGHFEKKLQSLLLEGLIRILQTVNDSDLMFIGIVGVDAHDSAEGINPHILQIVVARLQKCGDHDRRCKYRRKICMETTTSKVDDYSP